MCETNKSKFLAGWKLGLIDKLLLEHVGLPNILDLAVHLVNIFVWMSQGGHSEPLLLLALKGYRVVVAHVIIVSAQVLLILTLGLWTWA